jgi:hypothetical protein
VRQTGRVEQRAAEQPIKNVARSRAVATIAAAVHASDGDCVVNST